MCLGMTGRSCVQGRTQDGNVQGVAPIIRSRATGAIRGGTDSKRATQDESEEKRPDDGEDGHRQHFRSSRGHPGFSMPFGCRSGHGGASRWRSIAWLYRVLALSKRWRISSVKDRVTRATERNGTRSAPNSRKAKDRRYEDIHCGCSQRSHCGFVGPWSELGAGHSRGARESGCSGPTREPGRSGAAGESGRPGSAREPGRSGAAGESGRPGPTREPGRSGATGESGRSGAQDLERSNVVAMASQERRAAVNLRSPNAKRMVGRPAWPGPGGL